MASANARAGLPNPTSRSPWSAPQKPIPYESLKNRFGNLEGSVRSRGKGQPRSVVACDLIEAGLNEAAELWALWDSAASAAAEKARLWS